MKKICFLLFSVLAFALQAEFLKNPDENTLWLENGVGEFKGWRTADLLMQSMEGGGFTIQPGNETNGGRYVPNAPEYPWLVGEIVSVEHKTGYIGFSIGPYFGQVANPMSGIFAVKRVVEEKTSFLRIDVHGLILGFKYLKQVKVPENYIDYAKKDEGLEITVHLKEPAEDVSISFYDSYCMPRLMQDNQYKLQLYPKDEENPVVWSGTLKKVEYGGKGSLLFKASVLGGGIKTPLWGRYVK